MNILKKTFSKENVRGTELNVLIIGKMICERNFHDSINEGKDLDETIEEGLEFLLKEFDISYEFVLTKDEIKEKCENKHYDIIFIEDDYFKNDEKKNSLSEVINIIKENNEMNNSLIIGLMNVEDKVFRNILNENDIELILFNPVKIGQMVVILRNDFKWGINWIFIS